SQGRSFLRRRCHHRHGLPNQQQRRRPLVDLIVAGEEVGQIGRKLGMRVQQLLAVRPLALLNSLQIREQDFLQPLLALGRHVVLAGHDSSTRCSASSSRSFLRARKRSPVTASSLRPISALTWATVYPRKCFSSTAVRWSSGNWASALAKRSNCSLRAACW